MRRPFADDIALIPLMTLSFPMISMAISPGIRFTPDQQVNHIRGKQLVDKREGKRRHTIPFYNVPVRVQIIHQTPYGGQNAARQKYMAYDIYVEQVRAVCDQLQQRLDLAARPRRDNLIVVRRRNPKSADDHVPL